MSFDALRAGASPIRRFSRENGSELVMIRYRIAASSAAIMLAAIASAVSANAPQSGGHWQWETPPQFGPRSSPQPARRVWVPDQPKSGSCDCAMMKMSPDSCMAAEHGDR
ncbi:MAG TPA: hypothetical protein VF286_02010 [Acidiphilium sp.]|jgi:hypothetical protein|uniref:hypothetical protein n=1 Tax=Hephaestia caeni TaxID=645617 RepID=UPI001FE419A8|nr:hypothetical protein [Hephaestia caeni]